VFCEADSERAQRVAESCAHCGQQIRDRAAVVGGKEYHPGCLRCSVCSKQLGDASSPLFLRAGREGAFFCREHAGAESLGQCEACKQPVVAGQQGLKVRDLLFHAACLCCHECRCPLGFGAGVYVDERKAEASGKSEIRTYCEQHAKLLPPQGESANGAASSSSNSSSGGGGGGGGGGAATLAPGSACDVCKEVFVAAGGPILSLGDHRFHQRCLVCRVCKAPFPGGEGVFKDPVQPQAADSAAPPSFVCRQHYVELTAPRCAKCGDFIHTGKMVTLGATRYHGACYDAGV
jgi:hypothetical protein